MTSDSYDVRFWQTEVRKDRPTPYRVRWLVNGRRFGESFVKIALADSFKAQLISAARRGEAFDLETGLPESMVRKLRDVTFFDHAMEFTAVTWKDAAAKSRVSVIETLSRVVPVVTRDLKGAPDPDVLRAALRKNLNQGPTAGIPDQAEARALAWLARASRPLSAFQDESVVCDVLDALATRLDGKAAAPDYYARRRRVLHRVLGYAVRKKRLPKNPLSKQNLPEGWTAPEKPEEAVDPRSVGSPALIASMIAACAGIGRDQGPRFAALYGCMYYAMMRPSEVAALTRAGCQLPRTGWGYLAAQLRRAAHPGRRLGRAQRRGPDARLRQVHDRPRRRLDHPHGRHPPPGGEPAEAGATGMIFGGRMGGEIWLPLAFADVR